MPGEPLFRARWLGAAASIAALGGLAFGGCASGSELLGGTTGTGPGGTGASTGAGGTLATSTGGAGGGPQSTSSQGGTGGEPPTAAACPPGEFLTGLGAAGHADCAPIDEAASAAITSACSVYFGWIDSCGSCTQPPAKWGVVSSAGCMNGAGLGDTCTAMDLGGDVVQVLGLDMDGDVNGDDKFHVGLHCTPGDGQSNAGPCGPGEFVTGVSNGSVTCSPASGVVLDYVRESCSVYLGWRDSCDGCTTTPSSWGHASTLACENGAGTANTCTTATFGAESVQLFGLSTSGNVNDDDKFHVGLRCLEPPSAAGPGVGACPPGQLATGIEAGGALDCASPAPLVATWFRDHCSLYFGWRDSCSGCANAPAKWGKVRDGFCANGTGTNGSCTDTMLGAETVSLYGLNTDGDVDDNDKFYVAFTCL